jgi:hypothetical protein
MNLKDLFVSYTQVEPAKFEIEEPNNYFDIYSNADRAHQFIYSTSYENPEGVEAPQYSTPSSGQSDTQSTSSQSEDDMSTWRVDLPVLNTQGLDANGKYKSYGQISKYGLANKALYWMGLYSDLGLSRDKQIAVVSAMMGECGLNPRGAVEKQELTGNGNTKAGWAHAGEGAIGFTTWDTKKKFIQMYNNDPRRKGPKLPTNEAEYAKNSSRHIADLCDEDHALITYHFYKDMLNKSHNTFGDLIGDFYLQKAGRGYGKDAGKNASLFDQALYTGTVYQKSHYKLGHIKASKINSFERTMGWAQELADLVGYQYT